MSTSSGRRLTRALKQLKLPAEQDAGPISVEIAASLAELDGEGFSLAAAADFLPRTQLLVLRLSTPEASDGAATGVFSRRADGPQATRLPDSDPVTCLAELHTQHPDDLLLVWSPEDVASPTALIRAGANIVIVPVQRSGFSIRMVKGHPVVRLGSTIDTESETAQNVDVRWTTHVTRSSADRRLRLEFDVRAVDGRRARPLTEDEIARAYVEALRSTTVADSVLEHVDAAATKKTSHVALSLTSRGRLARNPSGGNPQAPILWNNRGDTLEATSNHLVSPRIVQYEMDQAGLATEYLTKNFVVADDRDGNPIGYYISSGRNSPHTAVRTVGDKNLTRTLLSSAGIPVARGRYFADAGQVEAAIELMTELTSVVVKPVDAAQGRGVTVDVRTDEKLRSAWETAFGVARTGVIVEKHFTGDEARFTVVDDEVVGVTRSRQPTITGDGKRTVRELLVELNERRRANPHLANRPVDLNEGRITRMLEHGLHPLSVLPAGEEFVVGLSTGWYGGSETEDITDSVHPSYLQAAVTAVRTVPGLTVAGLDVILEDYRAEATADNFIVLEVNSQPGLGIHHFPALGVARNAAGAIVRSDLALRSAAAYTSPVAATAGVATAPTDADPTTAGFAEALRSRGFSVVWHATDIIHAEAQGITTAFHGSYSAMTGKSGVIGARQPRVFAKLLERAGVPLGGGWKLFSRDADQSDFRNGTRALAHARTLTSPALRTAAGVIHPVDAEQEESFSKQWHDLCGRTSSGIAVLDVDLSTVHRFLIAYGEVIAVLGPDDAPAGDVFAGTAAAYGEVAARAVAAFPGLDMADVAVSVTDPSAVPDASNHAVLAVRAGRSLMPYDQGRDTGAPSIFDRIADLHAAQLPKSSGVG